MHALVSKIFSFAVDADELDANPLSRLRKRGKENVGRRVLSGAEASMFWHGIICKPVSKRIGLALRLALLRPAHVRTKLRASPFLSCTTWADHARTGLPRRADQEQAQSPCATVATGAENRQVSAAGKRRRRRISVHVAAQGQRTRYRSCPDCCHAPVL